MVALKQLRLLLLLPSAILCVLALAARSTMPLVLGRWSKVLFAFNALDVAALAVVVVAGLRGRVAAAVPALLVLLALTYMGATNNELALTPMAVPTMIAARFGIALYFGALAVEALRGGAAPRARRLLAVGTALFFFNVVDVAGIVIFRARALPTAGGDLPFRSKVDPARIEPDAIVFVGDSFVWGQGVAEHEAFANRVGAALAPKGQRVYNLGIIGAALPEYLEALKKVPARDTAVVCFFMNDMPPRESPLLRVRQMLVSAGRTSFAARLGADLVGIRTYPSSAEYEQSLIDDYDKRDGTYAARWQMLVTQFGQVAAEAKRDARHRPILVILPLVTEYATYPLRQAHVELAALGEANGFEVIDMLPVFAEAFPHGGAYKVGPNDDHFNAVVHAKVAEVLLAVLARRAGAEPTPPLLPR